MLKFFLKPILLQKKDTHSVSYELTPVDQTRRFHFPGWRRWGTSPRFSSRHCPNRNTFFEPEKQNLYLKNTFYFYIFSSSTRAGSTSHAHPENPPISPARTVTLSNNDNDNALEEFYRHFFVFVLFLIDKNI